MGIDGLKGEKGEMKHFRDAQRKAAALDEFKGNVFAVETAPFWDDELQEKKSQRDRINAKLDSEFAKNPKLTNEEKQEARKKALDAAFKPGELKRIEAAISNAEYHYLGAAKIMAPIGKAFAEALLPQMKH
jgi:alpha-galactosidase